MKRLLFCATAALLSGCMGTLPTDMHGMDPAVARAIAGDNKANIACSTLPTPWGQGALMQIVVDTAVVKNGGITIGDKCSSVTFSTTANPPKTVTTVTTTTPAPP